MIPISLNERILSAEAGFKEVLKLLVYGKASLPDPSFATRLARGGAFTREDFTNLYLAHVGGVPEPEFGILFQSCINARYFALISPAEFGLYGMTHELFWSTGHDTLSLGLLGALAFPPWVRSRLVHFAVGEGQGTGFLYGDRSGVVLTARHCVEGKPSFTMTCEGSRLEMHSLFFHRRLPVAKLMVSPLNRHGLTLEGQASEMSELYLAGYPRLPTLSTPSALFGTGYIAAAVSYREAPSFIISTPTPANAGNSGGPVLDKYGRVVALIEKHAAPTDSTDEVTDLPYLPYLYATNLAGCNPDDDSQWETISPSQPAQ
jgi:hypothetical protein